jgi:hypothetical protein
MDIFRKKKLKIDSGLFDDMSAVCAKCGYSSVGEMAEHLIRNGLAQIASGSEASFAASDEDRKIAEDQLRGLGYLN